MSPKCWKPILTFIFITLKTKTATGKGSRILSVVAKCKEQFKTVLERQECKALYFIQWQTRQTLFMCFIVGKTDTLRKPKKTWRELLEEIMKGDLQREGAKNLWITFFSSLFIMHRGHERGFLAVLSYSKRIFFWFLLLFYIKNSSLALNRRLWSKQHQRHAQVRIKYIGKDIWLVPILHWVLKVADKSQQIWRFKNQTKFSSAATNTSRIQKKWTYLNY